MSGTDKTMGGRLLRSVARIGCRALGDWKYEGPLPSVRRAVCLGVPHTSNMDGLLFLLLAESVGLKARFMIKSEWSRPPLGTVLDAFGAVPIDRSKANGMVDQMVEAFARHDDLLLLIPPEGTRSRADAWRSGFYRIALAAGVPVLPGYLDYRRKRGGFHPALELTGDVHKDMDALRAIYGDVATLARFPDQVGPIGLRDEDRSGSP